MQTVLDDAKTWFQQALVYQEELRVVVAEGFVGERSEDIHIGDKVIQDAYPINVSANSRLFVVRFPKFVAWQVVDESFHTSDDYEQGDEGFLRVLERSRYFDFIKDRYGWFTDIVGPAKHYRILTENEIIDVVATQPPDVEPWHDTQ